MQKCNPSRTSTCVCKWPKYQIKAAASASKQPLEFLCRSVQGNETTHWFNFHFKLTQISISHLLPEFWGGLEGTFWTCSPSPAHRYACSGGAGRVPRSPGTQSPFPSPALTEGATKATKNQGLFDVSTFLPGFGLAGGGLRERRPEFGEAAGPSGTAFNYHEPQTR